MVAFGEYSAKVTGFPRGDAVEKRAVRFGGGTNGSQFGCDSLPSIGDVCFGSLLLSGDLEACVFVCEPEGRLAGAALRLPSGVLGLRWGRIGAAAGWRQCLPCTLAVALCEHGGRAFEADACSAAPK